MRARSIAMVVWVGTIGAVIGSPAAAWANRIGTGFGAHEWVTSALLRLAGQLWYRRLRHRPPYPRLRRRYFSPASGGTDRLPPAASAGVVLFPRKRGN